MGYLQSSRYPMGYLQSSQYSKGNSPQQPLTSVCVPGCRLAVEGGIVGVGGGGSLV